MALLAASLASLVVACGGGADRPDADVRGVRLAAVIKALDNPYFVTMRSGLVVTARRSHARLDVAAARTGLQDTAGQAAQLDSLAAGRPRCYVVNPINETNLLPALSRVARHTPIVNVDSEVGTEAAKAVGVKITTYVGTDNRASGRLAADAMVRLVGRNARVAVITGIPGDRGSALRAAGFAQGARGRFRIVATLAADFERGKARLAAGLALRRDPHIAGFFAVNDIMALGAVDAVRAADREGAVKVVGFDGIRQALAAIGRGVLSATVAQYPFTIGRLGVEACLAALSGRAVPARVDAPVQVITRENVAQAQARFPNPVERFPDPFSR
jgi:ribose transport system substrate-binding protein